MKVVVVLLQKTGNNLVVQCVLPALTNQSKFYSINSMLPRPLFKDLKIWLLTITSSWFFLHLQVPHHYYLFFAMEFMTNSVDEWKHTVNVTKREHQMTSLFTEYRLVICHGSRLPNIWKENCNSRRFSKSVQEWQFYRFTVQMQMNGKYWRSNHLQDIDSQKKQQISVISTVAVTLDMILFFHLVSLEYCHCM